MDYCCGNGGTSIFLAKNGAQTIGIDISSQSIKNAKENAVQQGVERNLSFLVMHAENLQFDSGYFDLIACHGVLHHLNIQRAYSELARMLKPSGEIICAEPLVHNQITLI